MSDQHSKPTDGQAADNSISGGESSTSSPRQQIPASPPNFVSMDALMAASKVVNDMKLAHEIALDDNFKLQKNDPQVGSLEHQITETMKRAFWDSLTAKLLSTPPDYSHAVVLIDDVKQRLISCLPSPNSPTMSRIQEVLDMQLIEQKIQNEAFDLSYYASFVQEMMRQLCAPARDEIVANISNITDVVPLFQEIFRVLDVMNLDLANFTIQQMRPVIKQQVVEYERSKFEQFLKTEKDNGIDGLEYTREWLERSYDVLEASQNTSSQGANAERKKLYWTEKTDIPLSADNVLNGAYMELLNWTNNIYPETMLMDQTRFMNASTELSRLILATSTLVVSLTSYPQLNQNSAFREKLKNEVLSILSDTSEGQFRSKMLNIAEHLTSQINNHLRGENLPVMDSAQTIPIPPPFPPVGKPINANLAAITVVRLCQLPVPKNSFIYRLLFLKLPSAQSTNLKDRIGEVIKDDHPVKTLLHRRAMTFILQSISHRSGSNANIEVPQGLGVMSKELSAATTQVIRLVTYNKAVFTLHYTRLISGLLPNSTDNRGSPMPL